MADSVGLAFQIQDDYLDVVSEEEDLGKPVGSDIVEGKMTLMVVHALSKASEEDKKELISILKIKVILTLKGLLNYLKNMVQ